jgi:protein TonB
MCLRVRSRYALPLACLGALVWATAYTPAFSQTSAPSANGTDAAQERSQRQSDSVYRWIKLHAEPARKPEPVKPRAKPEGSAAVTRKPDTRDASGTAAQAMDETTSASGNTRTDTATDTQASAAAQLPASAASAAAAPTPVAEVEEELKPIAQPQPEIPREMRGGIANGRVILSFTVQPDGTVREAEVVRTTNRRLGKSALDAVSQWRFEPIRVAQTAQVEIEFGLQQ